MHITMHIIVGPGGCLGALFPEIVFPPAFRARSCPGLATLNECQRFLTTEDYELWLDPGVTDPARVADCLKPFDARLMKKYPISTRVNRAENDDQECAREVQIASILAAN